MALPVTDIATLQEYLAGVMDRAEDHGPGVTDIVLTLAGAIVWRKDDEPVKVMTHKGETKNVLWAHIGGTRYAFSYNHDDGCIEMRAGGTQGNVLHSFNNATPAAEIKQLFEAL